MSEPVSRGDKYPIPFGINGPLTGSPATKVFAKRGTVVVELPHTVTDPESPASGTLDDTSMLAVGGYEVELEAVWGDGTRITYPLPEPLIIRADAG